MHKRLRDNVPAAHVGAHRIRPNEAGIALGIEAEMDGGLQVSESPLPPLEGGIIKVPWPVQPDIVAESPTAHRRRRF